MNPLLIPPRLLFRLLDDVHTLAQAAARLPEVEERMNARLDELIAMGDRIERVIVDGLELGESIRASGDRIADLGEGVDKQIAEVLVTGGRVVEMGDRIEGHVEGLDKLANALLEQGRRIEASGVDVATRAKELADALPMLQRAVAMAEPLEGAVERLGRVVDRLPGGRQRAGS